MLTFSNRASFDPPNVLSLSRARPYRAWLATRKRRANRGAEAPGQRTAARRPLRRVGTPVPYRSCRSGRIVQLKITIFVPWVVEFCRSTLSGHALRGESDNSLPKACLTRERGARECRASGPSRARALSRTNHTKRNSAYVERAAGRRQRCSRQYFKSFAHQ